MLILSTSQTITNILALQYSMIGQLLVLYYNKGHNYKQRRMKIRNFNLLGHVLKNQKTSIYICQKANQKLRDYTFLESKTDELTSSMRTQAQTLKISNKTNQVINSYLQRLQKSKQIINKVTQSQITHEIVGNSDLSQIVGNYVHLKKCLDQEICQSLDKNGENYGDLAFLCCGFNVLDLKIWNKLLLASTLGYKQSPYFQKQSFMRSTRQYFKKFRPKVQTASFSCKFKLHQYNFNDIIDFTYFMKQTQDPNLFKIKFKPKSNSNSNSNSNFNQNDNQNQNGNQNENENENENLKSPNIKQYTRAFNLFHDRFFLYQKVHFVVNLNIYFIREELARYADDIIKFIDSWDLKQLLFVYLVFGRYGSGEANVMNRLVNRIFQRIQKHQIQDKQRLKRIYKAILKNWASSSKYQKQIWQTNMQPFLLQSFEQSKAQNKNGWIQIDWRNIAYSMICCGLTQSPLLQKIVEQLCKNKGNHNTTQIITQYLLVKQLQKEGKNLSANLPTNLKKQRKEYKKGHKQQIEYNPTQQFWYNVIKKVLGEDNTRVSVFISSYQIDILGLYQGQFYAFEIQGMHYRDQEDNLTGKKKVKREILAAYGIKVIQINAEQNQPKVIRRFKRGKAGELYIKNLLKQCIQESNQDNKQVQKKSVTQ